MPLTGSWIALSDGPCQAQAIDDAVLYSGFMISIILLSVAQLSLQRAIQVVTSGVISNHTDPFRMGSHLGLLGRVGVLYGRLSVCI
ncbi:hypothetical protein DBV39_17345 [Orrella marina]|uniref:Uncharacterized protein n=1 Tax=Orrella marina TaxID=2163011 RepID=A0A2R4XNC8_9BURK|nr:hypothetical protein DBV39_17345 [Orrella marina]